MLVLIWVKPSGVAMTFHNINHIGAGKGQKRPVHRIYADIGKLFFYLSVDLFCTGMGNRGS